MFAYTHQYHKHNSMNCALHIHRQTTQRNKSVKGKANQSESDREQTDASGLKRQKPEETKHQVC